MSTVSIHIEGHEDGTLDDPADLAVVLRHIAEQLMDGAGAFSHTPFPDDVVTPYDNSGDPEDRAFWSVQYGRY